MITVTIFLYAFMKYLGTILMHLITIYAVIIIMIIYFNFVLVCFVSCSAGGLVTAVAPVVINGNGLWVGWPGIHLENPDEPIPESDPSDITPTAGLKSNKVNTINNIFYNNSNLLKKKTYLDTLFFII